MNVCTVKFENVYKGFIGILIFLKENRHGQFCIACHRIVNSPGQLNLLHPHSRLQEVGNRVQTL